MNQIISLEDYRDAPEWLKEANHRIANQLAILVASVQAQAAAASKGPPQVPREEVSAILREAAGKIMGIAHLHRRLAETPKNSSIEAGEFLIKLVREVGTSLSLGERLHVSQRLGRCCVVTTDQAHTLSLLLTEIVMNAVKHAHPSGIPVNIQIACDRSDDGFIALEICDDGVGLPEGFDQERDGGLGFKLIRSLASKLNAVLQIETGDLGLCFHLRVPIEKPQPY